MRIDIQIDPNKALGGPEYRPYFEIELSATGEASASVGERHSSEDATTFDVWNQRALVWRGMLSQGCRVLPDPKAIEAIVAEAEPLLNRIAAGHTIAWNSASNAGQLNADAAEASKELKGLISESAWVDSERHVWTASDWIAAEGAARVARGYGLTADSSPEDFEEVGKRMVSDAAADSVMLTDIEAALGAMRLALKE